MLRYLVLPALVLVGLGLAALLHGVVAAPGTLAAVRQAGAAADALRGHLGLALPALSFVVMLVLWLRRGRDPRPLSIAAWYEPPERLRPGPMGALIDHDADLREVAATLVDLSVRGFFEIEEDVAGRALLPGQTHEHVFVLDPRRVLEWTRLPRYEEQLLRCLFKGGLHHRVRVSDMHEHFHRHYEDMQDAMWKELVQRGYYARHPREVKGIYAAFAFLASGAAYLLVLFAGGGVDDLAGQAVWLTGLPVLGFGWFMPMRTAKGTHVLRQVLGFREFLERVESDRFKRLIRSPEDFEKYLPYAIALGLEDRWAGVFDDIFSRLHDVDRKWGLYWLGADPRRRTSLRLELLELDRVSAAEEREREPAAG